MKIFCLKCGALSLSWCRQPQSLSIFWNGIFEVFDHRQASASLQPSENSHCPSCMQMRRPYLFSFLFTLISRTGYFYLARLLPVVYKVVGGFTWDAHTCLVSRNRQVHFRRKRKRYRLVCGSKSPRESATFSVEHWPRIDRVGKFWSHAIFL